jgi:hypothetical protein
MLAAEFSITIPSISEAPLLWAAVGLVLLLMCGALVGAVLWLASRKRAKLKPPV